MISCHAKFPEYQDKKILSKCQLKETIIWWRGLGWRAQNIKKQKKNRTTGVQNRPTLEMVPSGEVRPKQDGEAHTSGSSGAGSDGRAQTTGSGRDLWQVRTRWRRDLRCKRTRWCRDLWLRRSRLALYRAHNRLRTPCQDPADSMSISSVGPWHVASGN